jgi:hypothetical protein
MLQAGVNTMKSAIRKYASLAVGLFLFSAQAYAAPVTLDFGPQETPFGNLFSVIFDFSAFGGSDVVLTEIELTIAGDLDADHEYVDLSLENVIGLGRILDNDPSNDPFSFVGPNGLVDGSYQADENNSDPNSPAFGGGQTSTAPFNLDVTSLLAGDNRLVLHLDPSGSVGGHATSFHPDFSPLNPFAVAVVGTATFDVSLVPVPAAVWLFTSGLAGLIGISRRKQTA